MDSPDSTPTIGQQLRLAHEARQISLAQAAKATHIRLHYLEALENGQFNLLPSLTQGRGFLRSYAQYLGLSLDTLPTTLPGETNASPSAPAVPSARTNPLPSGEAEIIFAEIGVQLRLQRQRLGISLEDVERHTHLRLHNLNALEQGQLKALPSPVQARGMVSNYASFLGLDPEPLLLRFAEGLQADLYTRQAARPERKGGSSQAARPAGSLRRFFSIDLIVGALLVIFLAVFLSWGALRISSVRSSQTATSTAPSIADVLAQPSPTGTLQVDTGVPVGTPDLAQTPGLESLSTSSAAETTPQPTLAEAGSAATPTAFTITSGSAVQVNIIAHQRAWMRVLVDGEIGFEGRVTPGSAYVFSGSERVDVLTGNGAALQISFNQQDLGYLGILGEVASRTFTAAGVQTPTPGPTAPALAQPTPTLPTGLVFPTSVVP